MVTMVSMVLLLLNERGRKKVGRAEKAGFPINDYKDANPIQPQLFTPLHVEVLLSRLGGYRE